MQTGGIVFREYGDRPHTEFAAGSGNTDRDFAAIGNHYGAESHGTWFPGV
jgi:hypothetical protein